MITFLLIVEQNSRLLKKNHEISLIDSQPFSEANVNTHIKANANTHINSGCNQGGKKGHGN